MRRMSRMTIRTMCDVCGRVVRYTDDRQQEMEAMTDPDQFCDCPQPDEEDE